MQIITGTLVDMSLDLDGKGVSNIFFLTERRKPLTVTVSKSYVRVCDDEFSNTIYEGNLVDSEIVLGKANCYILFEGSLFGQPAAYRLEFNLTSRAFSFDSRAIVNVK